MESALVAMVAAGAVMLAMRMRRSPDPELHLEMSATVTDEVPDLPCPWCEAPTSEEDPVCPSCGRRFGPLVCR